MAKHRNYWWLFVLYSCAVFGHDLPINPRYLAIVRQTQLIIRDADDAPSEKALKYAITAYYNAATLVTRPLKPLLTLIDYSRPSTEPRLWVIDLSSNRILCRSLVAHGINSGKKYAKHFSNLEGSLKTCLGVFITKNSYMGKYGYSLRIHGLESGINDCAERRAIVMHGDSCASKYFLLLKGRLGYSHGCQAIEPQLASTIINLIKEGSVVVAYYPDRQWLRSSPFLQLSS